MKNFDLVHRFKILFWVVFLVQTSCTQQNSSLTAFSPVALFEAKQTVNTDLNVRENLLPSGDLFLNVDEWSEVYNVIAEVKYPNDPNQLAPSPESYGICSFDPDRTKQYSLEEWLELLSNYLLINDDASRSHTVAESDPRCSATPEPNPIPVPSPNPNPNPNPVPNPVPNPDPLPNPNPTPVPNPNPIPNPEPNPPTGGNPPSSSVTCDTQPAPNMAACSTCCAKICGQKDRFNGLVNFNFTAKKFCSSQVANPGVTLGYSTNVYFLNPDVHGYEEGSLSACCCGCWPKQ